ncbi:leucine-rich repeat domain-containing protein [Candidatus Palauibacter sp.]|uniref:leucine-rich repeat domain-containing protein n=1 Tax=Candidatus Palauibacter sp. TaxID=3101350 RepID=UPI003AF284DB
MRSLDYRSWSNLTIRRGACLLLVLLTTVSCGDDDPVAPPPPPPPPPPVATSITVSPATAMIFSLGETTQLTAQVLDQNGQVMPGAVVAWTSGDASVVTVDATGLAAAVGNGTASVTATSGSATGAATVTVSQAAAEVRVSPAEGMLGALGDTLRLSAEAVDANGNAVPGAAFTWTSSDTLVVTVDAGGLVTATGNGNASVTATLGEVTGSAAITVSQAAGEVRVTPAADTLTALGDTVRLTAEALDGNGNAVAGAAFTWMSSDATVATVDETGLVTATGDGSATVAATTGSEGVSGSAVIVVEAGSFRDDFDTPASQERWMTTHNAEVTVGDGVLSVTNQTAGRLGIAERASTPTVNEWTIQARMGRKTRKASPGVVSLTGHSRFTAIRLVLRTLDDSGSDRRSGEVADGPGTTGNYEFAVFDREAQEWIRITNMSGASDAVREDADEFTDITLGHEGGDFVAYAGDGQAEELFRLDPDGSRLGGVVLREVVEHVTGVWLVNQSEVGLTAVHDWVEVTGTESMAMVPDGAEIAEAVDEAARSEDVTGAAEALLALYGSTGGPNWTRSENWGTDAPLGEWYGVTTDEQGRVTELDLSNNGLIGPIPSEFGRLTSLRVLNLSVNRTAASSQRDAGIGPGPGPALDLTPEDHAELSGRIDLHDLGRDGRMLPSAKLTPAPESRAILDYPRDAGGRQEGLTGSIPPELGALAELKTLHLGGNSLTGPIPPELGALTALDTLSLWDNLLNGPIPAELGNLANLTYLSLSRNTLTGLIPPELGNLANLAVLSLYGNRLTGSIPSELGDLSALQYLWLLRNELTGSIPVELGDLENLENLNLLGNQLTGTIPPELGQLRSVWGLSLSQNGLTGPIPPELGQLQNIQQLSLSANELTGTIPRELASVQSLTRLWLYRNNLGGEISAEFGSLTSLEYLVLYDNSLTEEIPPELGQLENLQRLSLHGNELTGSIPPELGSLQSLRWLELGRHQRGNHLTGSVPPELGQLANLEQLHLHTNQLTGSIPPELGGLSKLIALSLGSNGLTGNVPKEIGDLSELQLMTLDANQLSGPLPPELGRLRNMMWLWIGANNLSGPIPLEFVNLPLKTFYWGDNDLCAPLDEAFRAWLRSIEDYGGGENCVSEAERAALVKLYETTGGPNWTNNEGWLTDKPVGDWYGVDTQEGGVTHLQLNENALSGPIPSELGDLSDLRSLGLVNNELTGSIPPELGSLDSLKWLAIGINGLTGEIPPEVGRLTSLEGLALWDNSLEGDIPPELGNLASLEHLSLGGNRLTGEIPSVLGRLTSLDYLYLGNNRLTGEIPPELADLTSLRAELHLGNNGLTGEIPPELGNLASLEKLWLSDNDLTGGIPPELGNLSALVELGLNNNALAGPIPLELDGLSSLRVLNFWNNQLTGSIPVELGSLGELTSLDLGSNNLTGSVPPELGDLTNLERLWLHNNDLTGEIPPELGNLTDLEALNLDGNDLTGPLPSELGNLASLRLLRVWGNRLSGPIPLEFVNLPLTDFKWGGNDLCAPLDEAFQAWLRSIEDYGGGENCAAGRSSVFGEALRLQALRVARDR